MQGDRGMGHRGSVGGKHRTSKTAEWENRGGIAAKEISSVNGDNSYPGSNDGGMDGSKRGEEEGKKERNERIVGREELPLAGFPQEVL